MRATYHVAVLALVGATTIAPFGGDGRSHAAAVAAATASPAPAQGQIFSPTLSTPFSPAPTTGGAPPVARPAGTTTAAAAPIAVAAGPRRWVQNFKPTELYDGPDSAARGIGTASQFSTFELVEDPSGARAKLFDHGQGLGRLPSTVWVNASDIGPSGPPNPQFELPTGGMDPTSGKKAPERIGTGWPRIPSAESAVVVDGDSGAILYGKNAHVRHAPASLTKIMTALVALERGKPQDRIKIDVDIAGMWESTLMGLELGDELSLETLLYGLMLPSGNDAAIQIARHIGGSEERFAELMNERARAIGLQNSQFRNPHGLDQEGHYSTPYDLAAMARRGMEDGLFYNLSATKVWEGEGYILKNLNGLLGQYPGADGVKVGFTDNAGKCLVASATRNGHRVFVTVIRSYDPSGDSRMLLDYAFQNYQW